MCDTRYNYLTQRRDRKGRFQPSRPRNLRRGSLYVVNPLNSTAPAIARYRSAAYGNYAVFSVHGEPVFADKNTVRFADKSQVELYFRK